MCASRQFSTPNQQGTPKVAHKLLSVLPLQSALKLIDLREGFGVECNLLTNLLNTTDHRRVISTIEDPGDHWIGVIG